MKGLTIIILLLANLSLCTAQTKTERGNNAILFAFLPSSFHNIYGVSFGPIGSEAICNKPYTKFSHGLNVQVPGQGVMQLFYLGNNPYKKILNEDEYLQEMLRIDSTLNKAIHNGLIISLFGTFTDKINGLSISLFMSMGKEINGISINPFWNLYTRNNGISIGLFNTSLETKGMQIGMVNSTFKLKGIQLGLWNRNNKRSTPFVNW